MQKSAPSLNSHQFHKNGGDFQKQMYFYRTNRLYIDFILVVLVSVALAPTGHVQQSFILAGCDATKPPPTKKPDTGKEGAPAWVVVVSILGGVVIGVIVTAIIITVVMRRRGRGYDRLNELMTPVPTQEHLLACDILDSLQ